VLITQTNLILSTNILPWLPAGFVAIGVSQSVPTNFFAQRYTYTFGNIVTNHFYTNWSTLTKTLTIVPQTFAPAGSGLIKTNFSTVTTKGVGGDFYILPPGVIGYIFQPGLVITNRGSVVTVTPLITDTNLVTVNQKQVTTFFTNFSYIVYTIQLQTVSSTNIFQGIEKITFVRRDFDSLIGTFFQPITNKYTLTSIANNILVPHPIQRVVNAPDILITAHDSGIAPSAFTRSINFNQTSILPGLAGPGTIDIRSTLDINKGMPLFLNVAAGTELTQALIFYWGTFSGSTNAPVVYPSGTSIANLENQILMSVTSTSLPSGTNGVAYSGGGFQLTGTGGQPPYTWTIVGNALPPGLNLSSDGIISGVPTNSATFDFTVQMTDSPARSIYQPLSITIH
jgi:hypothetical protein